MLTWPFAPAPEFPLFDSTRERPPPPAPVTSAQVETGLASAPVAGSADTAANFDGQLSELVKNGYYPDPDLAAPILSGSTAPVQGQKTVTTSPDGSVTTTNNVYNNTFTNNYVETTQTTTTTVVPVTGSPTTTTTTQPPLIDGVKPASDQLTDCDKYPSSVGCMQYGDVPVPEVLPTSAVSIALSPTSLGSGSCPPPKILDLHGQSDITLSYQPYCDFSTSIKPIIVAFAWLTAGFIVMGAVRES